MVCCNFARVPCAGAGAAGCGPGAAGGARGGGRLAGAVPRRGAAVAALARRAPNVLSLAASLAAQPGDSEWILGLGYGCKAQLWLAALLLIN